MKLLNVIICLIITSICYSQLPIKSGIVYYKFEHKIPNKSCLVYYMGSKNEEYQNRPRPNFGQYELKRQQEDKKSVFSVKRNVIGKYDFYWDVWDRKSGESKECYKKYIGKFEIQIPIESVSNIRMYEVLGIGKKRRITKMKFHCKPEFIFVDKENIQVKIKSINVTISGTEGTQGFAETKKLGEMYQAYLDDPNKTEKDGAMFEEIDRVVRDHVKILFDTFDDSVEMYEIDLD